MKDVVRPLARSGGLCVSRYPPQETLAFRLKHLLVTRDRDLLRVIELDCVLRRKPKDRVAT